MLVVPEIEIGLGAVLEHIHFAVLKRAHRARIDIEVGIETSGCAPLIRAFRAVLRAPPP